jgi:hypothetical protein
MAAASALGDCWLRDSSVAQRGALVRGFRANLRPTVAFRKQKKATRSPGEPPRLIFPALGAYILPSVSSASRT